MLQMCLTKLKEMKSESLWTADFWKQYGRNYSTTSLASSCTSLSAWWWPWPEMILWLGVTLWLTMVNPRHIRGTSTTCCESTAQLTGENSGTPHIHNTADSQNKTLSCLSCWPHGPISRESPFLFLGKKTWCGEGATLCHHRQGMTGIEYLRSFTGREQQLPKGVEKQGFKIKISGWFI